MVKISLIYTIIHKSLDDIRVLQQMAFNPSQALAEFSKYPQNVARST